MNKDEATKQWIAEHTLGDLKPHDGAIMCFREGYEAGQRAERERIMDKIEDIQYSARSTGEYVTALRSLMQGLRADPAESGE